MNKRGQIPSTLVWIAAFVIIFFLMFVFTSTSLYIAKNKKAVDSVSFGKIDNSQSDLVSVLTLNSILKTRVDYVIEGKTEKLTIMELILRWESMRDKHDEQKLFGDSVANEINKLLGFMKTDYYFSAKYYSEYSVPRYLEASNFQPDAWPYKYSAMPKPYSSKLAKILTDPVFLEIKSKDGRKIKVRLYLSNDE